MSFTVKCNQCKRGVEMDNNFNSKEAEISFEGETDQWIPGVFIMCDCENEIYIYILRRSV